MNDYPKFSINGVELSSAQNMTMWTALQSFGVDMENPFALGKDENGLKMTELYLKRVKEINDIAIKTTP